MSFKKILSNGKKKVAWLCDTDKTKGDQLLYLSEIAQKAGVDCIFIGSSLQLRDNIDLCVEQIKTICNIPVILFPGSGLQISEKADALLFLSLISGRNPELLIGQHVSTAYRIKQSQLEVIPTGYMLIDGGSPTSVGYISNTLPIPNDKTDIAISTAIAGELLGLQAIYLEAGSGASHCVPPLMVKQVKDHLNIPLIVGGGIRDAQTAQNLAQNGADLLVIGNSVESNPNCLKQIVQAIHS